MQRATDKTCTKNIYFCPIIVFETEFKVPVKLCFFINLNVFIFNLYSFNNKLSRFCAFDTEHVFSLVCAFIFFDLHKLRMFLISSGLYFIISVDKFIQSSEC